MESPFILKIFEGEELAPEWRICVNITFGHEEDAFVKYVITPEEIDIIRKAERWIEIENTLINKDKAEVIIFYTEIKTLEGKWILYSPEKCEEILKQELQHELAARQVIDNGGLNALNDNFQKFFETMQNNK